MPRLTRRQLFAALRAIEARVPVELVADLLGVDVETATDKVASLKRRRPVAVEDADWLYVNREAT